MPPRTIPRARPADRAPLSRVGDAPRSCHTSRMQTHSTAAPSPRELTVRAIILGGVITLPVHRGERLSGAEGRADLRDLDPGGGDFDGDPALSARRDDPGEQHRPDRRVRGGNAGGDHLRAARARDGRLVARLSVLRHRGDHDDGRVPGRHVFGAPAPRARGRYRPALSRGPCRRRSAEGRRRQSRGRGGERARPAGHRRQQPGVGRFRDPDADAAGGGGGDAVLPGSAAARPRFRRACRSRWSGWDIWSDCRSGWRCCSGSSSASGSRCRS